MLTELLPILAITFVAFALFFILMAIGFIIQKKPIKGSCGGTATLMGDKECSFCGKDPNKCEEIKQSKDTTAKSDELGKSAL